MDIPPNKTMSEKEAEKDQKDKIVKARANTNRVIISIYSESPTKRLQQKHNPATKKTMRTRGYDRRAQLLSYASELRCAGSEPMEWSRRNSRPRSKVTPIFPFSCPPRSKYCIVNAQCMALPKSDQK
jgi:hypothetical protein